MKKTLRVHNRHNQKNKKWQVYITSDDDIVAGDWCYAIELGEVFQCKESNEPEDHYISTTDKVYYTNIDPHHCSKIEATNDTELVDDERWNKITQLPTPPKSFIKRFCKMADVNIITIECECELSTDPLLRYILKVDSDNALIISAINISFR